MNIAHPGNEAGQILRFWHQVEFFIPFDLQQQVVEAHDAEWAVKNWPAPALGSAPLWNIAVPPGRYLTGFDVYFGVFDKALMADVTRDIVQAVLAPDETLEQEERGGLEGLTCVAKLKAGPAGEPLFEDVSVSTAPWALGRIGHDGNLQGLDFNAFEAGIEDLQERLRTFRNARTAAYLADPARPQGVAPAPRPLSETDLLALQALFENWTGFHPQRSNAVPLIVIRAKSTEETSKKRSAQPNAPAQGAFPLEAMAGGGADGDDFSPDEGNIEIDILNSFFAKDIARAIASLKQDGPGAVLQAYLAPLPVQHRLDLYGAQGREEIMRMLAPARLPAAHWLDAPEHAMSLMQQFAINSMFDRLKSAGIFSVNGPPGTGKTTLLRDVFAENIARRARVLAGLAKAGDAFVGTVTVDFQGAGRCSVSRLRDELTGFEMVVASSNNAAVENLSRDLPKSKSLGKPGRSPWRNADGSPTIGYLQPVAHNIAARKAKGDYVKLDADNAPWGLIAATLGNQGNRGSFAFRLGVDAKRSDPPAKGFDPRLHQSLWTWREKYAGPDFATARASFKAADEAVQERLKQLDAYAVLCNRLGDHTHASFCADAVEVLAQALRVVETARIELAEIDQDIAACVRQLASLRAEARLIDAGRPAWWLRWFQRARAKAFEEDMADNRRAQRDWLARQRAADAAQRTAASRLHEAARLHANAHAGVARAEEEWVQLQRRRATLAAAFPTVAAPRSSASLDDAAWQIKGLWHDETTNALRADLFAAALALHEAWLAEVLQTGAGFGANVVAFSHLLSGKRLLQREHALTLWQSVFMLVPIVSSTFASIASQFRDLGAGSLGWVFVDEAGQAVPQAAVGALWRARRAVVVGDPLQIEPVFTVPIKLIQALARAARLDPAQPVEPHLVSVQNLADEANGLGAWIDAQGSAQWIGSPLRVHRRCVDPMFTIANQIAYEGKMIFFDPDNPAARLPPPDSLDIGPSAWVNVSGRTHDKQVVPEQVGLVRSAIVELYLRTGELPELYVISPFRRIKESLVRTLLQGDAWPQGAQPPARALREWCRMRIGTVHTFQGKEESLVWMVLGCDADTRGAAAWAAGKPNLFNVALTRAKHRFFLIGDVGLWAGLPHFAEASATLLPRIRPDEFLQRVRTGTAGAGILATDA